MRVATTLTLATSYRALGRWMPKPSFVFQVYGTARDRRAYFPPWVEERVEASFPIAVMRYRRRWGILAGTPYDADRLEAEPALAVELVESVLHRFPDVPIALAGRLPAFLYRAGYGVHRPAVSGSLGTRFAMREIGLALAKRVGRDPATLCAAVIGASGFTGSRVVADYASVFGRVVAVDPYREVSSEQPANVTTAIEALREVDVALLLTGRGDDIEPFLGRLPRGLVIADDTHPCLSPVMICRLQQAGVVVLKAVMRSAAPMWIRPHMPRFSAEDVPGCLLEALVVAEHGEGVLENLHTFSTAARALDFSPLLMSHPAPV